MKIRIGVRVMSLWGCGGVHGVGGGEVSCRRVGRSVTATVDHVYDRLEHVGGYWIKESGKRTRW